MSIQIDREKCVGCSRCKNICPGNLIAVNQERRAFLKRPYDCWGCTACLKECPVCAVSLVLGPELSGMGETLTVKKADTRYIWEVTDRYGRVKKLVTDTKKANAY